MFRCDDTGTGWSQEAGLVKLFEVSVRVSDVAQKLGREIRS